MLWLKNHVMVIGQVLCIDAVVEALPVILVSEKEWRGAKHPEGMGSIFVR